MKKSMMAVAAALILPTMISCSTGDELTAKVGEPKDTMQQVTIRFTFGSISQQAMTRATLTESQMTDLWLFDCMNGELKATIHQTSTDDGFGALTLNADFGQHTFYFVASRGDSPTIDGTTITWTRPSDTFWQSITLNVEPQTNTSQSVTLERIVTRLRIAVTDEVPDNLKTLSITPSTWYYGIDYRTAEPTASQATPRSVTVPDSYIGTTGNLAMSIYGFCPEDGFETDVNVSAADASSATIADIDLKTVPLERNRITNYSGSLFTQNRAIAVTTDDEWLEDYTTTW